MFTRLFNGLAAWFADWRLRRRAYEELASLDDRSLADIGITRGEIPYVLSSRQVAEARTAELAIRGLRHAG